MSAPLDEAREIAELNHGSVHAFDIIYHRYHQNVYKNIFKLVHSPEYAEEILQDVFLSLWQNRFRIRTDKSVGNWLFVVSYNKSIDFLKNKIKQHIEYISDYEHISLTEDESHEDYHKLELQMEILGDAVNKLSPRKKEVFRLYRYEGCSKEAIADMMGISPNSVSDYLKQANQDIKKYISTQPIDKVSLAIDSFHLS